ncbi:MAG: peptide ABC transporter substrate-binding protein [Pseudomonadota bacterium]
MNLRRLTPCLPLLLAITACHGTSDAEKKKHTDTLVVACREPASLDPAYMVDRNDVGVVVNLCTGLFRPAPDGGMPSPGLATSWACVDGGRRCTFQLDPGAAWSDGTPLTAADLEWSWRRIVAPETGSPGAETLHVIRGMGACTRGETCAPGIRVLGPHAIEVQLEEPQPMLPYIMAHPRWCPVQKHVVEAAGAAWTEPENFVGNGDYRPAAWRRGVSMTLERTAGADGPARVELRFTGSEDTALRWFEAGEVDVVDGLVPLDRVQELRRERPGAVRIAPAASVFYLAPNHRSPPFDAVELRRAVQRGLDRELLVATVLGTGQVPATSLVPQIVATISGYRPPAVCSGRDLGQARSAMAASGHPGGTGLAAVELLYNRSTTMTRIMTFLQQDLEDVIGLRTSLRSMEWASFLDAVRGGDFRIARFGLSGEPDPMDYLGALTTGAPNNIGGYSSPEYDRLVHEARNTAAPARRNGLLADAEAILCADAGVIPIYHAVTVLLARERIRGYEANHSGLHPLRDVVLGE